MIAAPHRRLVSSLIVITVFWMLVGTMVYAYLHTTFQDGELLITLLFHTLGRLAWVAIFLMGSAGLALLIRAADIFTVAIGLRPEMYRGALTTIGVLPQPALPEGYDHTQPDPELEGIFSAWKEKERLDIKATKVAAALAKENTHTKRPLEKLDIQAVQALAKANTPAARLFWSVYHILKAADLPASPRPGEHGNASLLEHSLRVSAALAWVWRDDARIALEQSQTRVTGLPTEVGRPMRTEPYPLEIAILAGICHDIGKIACFRRDKEGVITVVGLHDMVGSRILGLLPALWDLRDEQGNPDTFLQHLLTQSIRYYHHPGAFPLSGFKRELLAPDPAIKQLMGDIHRADLIAGGLEGRAEEVAQDYLEEDELEEQSLDAQIWDTFLFLLEDESRINSPSPARRLAYKKGPILYLIEPKIRERICDHLSITRHDYATPNNGNPGKIIQIIASKLDDMGLLVKTIGKVTVAKPEGAAVRLRFESSKKNADGDATEHTDTKIPHYVVRIPPESVFAPLLALENYPAELSVQGLFWPQFAPKKTSAQGPDTIPATAESAEAQPAGSQSADTVSGTGDDGAGEPLEADEEVASIDQASPSDTGKDAGNDEDGNISSSELGADDPGEDDPFAGASEAPAPSEPKGAEGPAAPALMVDTKTVIAVPPSTRGTHPGN
ncbi:metal-dependent phosphohydrolase, partial [Acidithiobacillus sp.]|uniref:metal-dependent phosphohydrolase n=1 Tax=Acidithiobacillus sp. TaxID=1872118 RepID=UPI003D07405E